MNNKELLYFKVGSNVISAPKSDCDNKIIDCSQVKVLVWMPDRPFYKFEHNDLAQKIAEEEDIYRLEGFESPDLLIDKEIVETLEKRASAPQNKTPYEVGPTFRMSPNLYTMMYKALESNRMPPAYRKRIVRALRANGVYKVSKKRTKNKTIEAELVQNVK